MDNKKLLSLILLSISVVSWSGVSSAYIITTLSATAYNTDVDVMNTNLGLIDPGLAFEDFEDVHLISGLSISWDDAAAVTTLKATLSFSAAKTNWNNSRVLQNSPNNKGSVVGPSDKLTFNYLSGTTLFGIGISHMESSRNATPTISINGVEQVFDLYSNPNYTDEVDYSGDDYRNAYLVIETEPGDAAMFSFSIERGTLTGLKEDVILFDHLAVQAGISPVPVPAAVWLFASGLIGFVGMARRNK